MADVKEVTPQLELASDSEGHHEYPPTSVRGQLAGWHANRGDRSFLRAMIPRWKAGTTDDEVIYNPIRLLATMKAMDWMYFLCGWWAWTCDGYDFFAVSVTLVEMTKQFGVEKHTLTTSITLTLLFRSVGAVVFGLLADRYGRRWTLCINMLLIAVFEFASGVCNTYTQFLGVRACFGIVMGGVWGQAMATALENVPVQARGFCSGILQPGYSFGYLLAAVINLTVVPNSKYGWRSVYFIGAGFSVTSAIFRALLPESKQYREAREIARVEGKQKGQGKRFLKETVAMLKANWIRVIWGIVVMAAFNFLSHGTQDLYPTYLQVSKGISAKSANVSTIIANAVCIVGGAVAGYLSQYLGRRLCILVFCCWCAAFIPLWILPHDFAGLTAGGSMILFGMQATFGVVPIYLGEVSPPAFRASFAGICYQLGNMASSAAAQIESTAGDKLKTTLPNGKIVPDYATVQAMLVGIVLAFLIVCVLLGPEADGSHFEKAKTATQEGAGITETQDLVHGRGLVRRESVVLDEKNVSEKV
ncbi:hypothetical protein Q8F55_003537 [Vanrija albida]|uniref:Major facilitator superfamily (MFS) profile domain-containing protein n=1 Tax=Vanrija albida TaxID=181172 RepID=A0ABR3Q493_9TREE